MIKKRKAAVNSLRAKCQVHCLASAIPQLTHYYSYYYLLSRYHKLSTLTAP